MSTRTLILLVACVAFMLGFSWLLVRHWDHRPLRYRLLGNILLVALGPATVIIDSDNLAMVFLIGGGLLLGGLAFRIAAERMESV